MTCETKKIITLTQAEQQVIHDLYEILDEDRALTVNEIWDILLGIHDKDNSILADYGYNIDIVD